MSREERREPAVVVPAVGTASSTAIIRSLGRRGIHTIVVSEEADRPAFWSKYCDESLAVPSPSDDLPGYRDALLSLARRPEVRTIVPVREADVFVLAKYRSAFAEHVATPWPTIESLHSVHDRARLFDAAEAAGVRVPDTRLVDDVEDWDRELIVKARYAILTGDYLEDFPSDRVGDPPKTLFLERDARGHDVEELTEAMGHVPIAQTYVRGTEYCLRALYDRGEVVATSQKQFRRGYKYPRGPSIFHETVDLPELEAAGLALLDELEWHGVASVGFIRDDSGAFNLLEVNPRFWSQVSMDIRAGVDYPNHYWKLANGAPPIMEGEYRPGTATHLLRGELVHLHSVIFENYPLAERPSPVGTAWDIARSLVEHPNFDFLSLDDPGPFVRDVLNSGRNAFSR